MTCEQFLDDLIAYLRGELPLENMNRMREHASACLACSSELKKTENAMRVISASEDAPIIRLVYSYIANAIDQKASDIHFERRSGMLKVRCRVDGILNDMEQSIDEDAAIPPEIRVMLKEGKRMIAASVLARLKVMADVDATISDAPQKGKIDIFFQEKNYSLAVLFMPTAFGEYAVCHILPMNAPIAIEDMGISEQTLKRIYGIAGSHMGLFLIGGPSGSGKTTVALSITQHLASPDRNVVSIEDPVFSIMENVTQIEVTDHKGLTALALISRLRWLDPDIIAVPEIADSDLAKKCVSLAMEGTLVIATIHSDDAVEAIWNFRTKFGDPKMSASMVVGATNQRLVRKICPDCREEYLPSKRALESLNLQGSDAKFMHGAGCEKCHNTGYRGRLLIAEALEMTRELAYIFIKAGNLDQVKAGMQEYVAPRMIDDGRQKALAGITTAEEVCRVLGLDY